MFIITAEEARKHVEPAKLTHLSIGPERPMVRPGAHITFQAHGLDQHGRPVEVSGVTWSAKGGEVDDRGGFKAGPEEGEYLVEAAVGSLHAQTIVLISEETAPSPPTAPTGIKGLKWSGEVPSQKWMNFYTKVMAKYATAGGLRVQVSFDIAPDGGLLPQRIEETKAALRELGLDDNVQQTR